MERYHTIDSRLEKENGNGVFVILDAHTDRKQIKVVYDKGFMSDYITVYKSEAIKGKWAGDVSHSQTVKKAINSLIKYHKLGD